MIATYSWGEKIIQLFILLFKSEGITIHMLACFYTYFLLCIVLVLKIDLKDYTSGAWRYNTNNRSPDVPLFQLKTQFTHSFT